jgi:hypothetical protein
MAPDVLRGILEAKGRATAAQGVSAKAFKPMPISELNQAGAFAVALVGRVFLPTFYCNFNSLQGKLAERQGFEPWVGANRQRFSRPPHSTTLPPLRASGVVSSAGDSRAIHDVQETNGQCGAALMRAITGCCVPRAWQGAIRGLTVGRRRARSRVSATGILG